MHKIKLLLVDQPLPAVCMHMAFEHLSEFDVLGKVHCYEDLLCQAPLLQPDVILIDSTLTGGDVLQVVNCLRQSVPHARLIILAGRVDNGSISMLLHSGIHGYQLKHIEFQQLLQAIRDVIKGGISLDPAVAVHMIQSLQQRRDQPAIDQLTQRELEVLDLLIEGLSNHQIADQLAIGHRTVATHVEHILDKLQASSRTQAAVFALRKGIVPLHS